LSGISHAVFISYASQDSEAAQRICEALRAAGIEVFLDQSELRGGDAWDRQIRRQIHDCALFIPVISANAHARVEGYFRLEWKLAVDRSHLMAPDQTFLLPVVIDDTAQADERIPDRFRELQWTRAPGGQASPAFIERVQRLLSPAPATTQPLTGVGSGVTPAPKEPVRASSRSKLTGLVIVAVIVAASLAYWALDRFWISKHVPASQPVASAAPVTTPLANAAPFAPPPHSIAVLPFVNMSGDKEQDYFSDGLSEELLNDLARINDLQVAARTSAFSFKGKDTDIGTIARKLNVGAVLEGSVRRSAHTVRITAQLINAVTGFHMWSQTYDRDLGDVLKLQTELAESVAGAFKVTLLGDVAAKVEVGATRNPAAFDAYLRASKAYFAQGNEHEQDSLVALAGYTEAIRLDPNYALAYAARSIALQAHAENYVTGALVRDYLNKAQADAQRAITLAPDLGEAHLALAVLYKRSLDFTRASQEFTRALALAPGSARQLRNYGVFGVMMGHTQAGLGAAHRSVMLDPLNSDTHSDLGKSLLLARRYDEALAALKDAKALDPSEGGDMPYGLDMLTT
jgi:TolB-like protein/Flp pilus assembly protein TadD